VSVLVSLVTYMGPEARRVILLTIMFCRESLLFMVLQNEDIL
jgi:hypothetical protein